MASPAFDPLLTFPLQPGVVLLGGELPDVAEPAGETVIDTFTPYGTGYRIELASMVEAYRCGWNIKPGRMGGRPLDYAPCTFTKSAC